MSKEGRTDVLTLTDRWATRLVLLTNELKDLVEENELLGDKQSKGSDEK